MTAGHASAAGMYRPRRLHGFPHGLPDLWCGRIPEHCVSSIGFVTSLSSGMQGF